MEFQSFRKGLIARTPRVTSGAGAAGVGRVFGIWKVYRAAVMSLKKAYSAFFFALPVAAFFAAFFAPAFFTTFFVRVGAVSPFLGLAAALVQFFLAVVFCFNRSEVCFGCKVILLQLNVLLVFHYGNYFAFTDVHTF